MRALFVALGVTAGIFVAEATAQDWPERDKAYKACFAPASPDDTIEGCSKAIDLGAHYDPKTFNGILNNRGIAFEKRHEYQRAIKDFDLAIRVSPREILPYINRANAQMRTGKFVEALLDTTHVLDKIPAQPNALALQCFLVAATDDRPEHAEPVCAQSLKLRPDNTTTLAGRALALYRQGKYEEALQNCDKGLKKDAQDEQLLFLRGIIKQKLGDSSGDADIAAAVALYANIRDGFPVAIDRHDP